MLWKYTCVRCLFLWHALVHRCVDDNNHKFTTRATELIIVHLDEVSFVRLFIERCHSHCSDTDFIGMLKVYRYEFAMKMECANRAAHLDWCTRDLYVIFRMSAKPRCSHQSDTHSYLPLSGDTHWHGCAATFSYDNDCGDDKQRQLLWKDTHTHALAGLELEMEYAKCMVLVCGLARRKQPIEQVCDSSKRNDRYIRRAEPSGVWRGLFALIRVPFIAETHKVAIAAGFKFQSETQSRSCNLGQKL